MKFVVPLMAVTQVVSYLITAVAPNTCSVKDITPAADFDAGKFAGRWLTFLSLPPDGRNGFNHVVKWWMLDTSTETGALRVLLAEQFPDMKDCLYSEALLLNTSTPGKFTLQRTTNERVSSTLDVWVTDTDYLSYALVYGCGLEDTFGRCTTPYTQVLTRDGHLAPAQVEAVATSLNVLCLKEALFDIRNISHQMHIFSDCVLPSSFKEFNATVNGTHKHVKNLEPSGSLSDDRKVFAIVAGIVAGVILLFGGAFLVDKYWKPNYTVLK